MNGDVGAPGGSLLQEQKRLASGIGCGVEKVAVLAPVARTVNGCRLAGSVSGLVSAWKSCSMMSRFRVISSEVDTLASQKSVSAPAPGGFGAIHWNWGHERYGSASWPAAV